MLIGQFSLEKRNSFGQLTCLINYVSALTPPVRLAAGGAAVARLVFVLCQTNATTTIDTCRVLLSSYITNSDQNSAQFVAGNDRRAGSIAIATVESVARDLKLCESTQTGLSPSLSVLFTLVIVVVCSIDPPRVGGNTIEPNCRSRRRRSNERAI